MKTQSKKRKWVSLLSSTALLSSVLVIGVPTILTSCSKSSTQDNNVNPDTHQPDSGGDGGNNGGSDNQNQEQAKKVVLNTEVNSFGLVDNLINQQNTPVNMQEYWNTYLNKEENKALVIQNAKDFSKEQLANLDIKVETKDVLSTWTPNTESTEGNGYTAFKDWSKKIDVEVLYGSKNNQQFDITSLGDLKNKLNKYKSLSESLSSITGVEAILLDSNYHAPGNQNIYAYEIANSELAIDENKEYLQIHILEKLGKVVNKDIMLKLPVSDLNIKTKYNVTVSQKQEDKTVEVSSTPVESTIKYEVAIDGKQEIKNLDTVYIQTNQDQTEVSNKKGSDILVNLGFATKKTSTQKTNRNQTNQENKEELVFNNDAISAATNIYNVNWTATATDVSEVKEDVQLTASSQGESNNSAATKKYKTDVKLTATPIEGHTLLDESGKKTEKIEINLPLNVESSKNRDAFTISEHTSYIPIWGSHNISAKSFYAWWLQNGTKYWEWIVKNEIGEQYFTNVNFKIAPQDGTNGSCVRDKNHHPRITYDVWYDSDSIWSNGSTTKKTFSLTLASVTLDVK